MSISHDHGDIVFQCDATGCRKTLETGTSNFEAARNLLRRARWKPKNVSGEWKHTCADCQPAATEGRP